MNFIAEAKQWYKLHSIWLFGAIALFALAWFFLGPVRTFIPLGGFISAIVLLAVIGAIVRVLPQADVEKVGAATLAGTQAMGHALSSEYNTAKGALSDRMRAGTTSSSAAINDPPRV